MSRIAVVIEKNIVTNVINIDDDTPKELYDLEIDPESNITIGWKYIAGEFIEPDPIPPIEAGE